MNSKRFVLILGFGLALLLALVWGLGSGFAPARAYTNESATPAPTIGKSAFLRPVQNPLEESIPGGYVQRSMPSRSSSAVIANGDFENGRDGSWQEYSTHGWDVITEMSNMPVEPHNGSWAAWLGGELDDVSYLSQSIVIPGGTSTLRFWSWIASLDDCGYDVGLVKINGTNVQTINLCADNNTNGWVERTVDLSSYAGQTVTLQIRVETDASLNSNYFVDDVTLDTTVPPVTTSYTYLPVALSGFWAGYFDDFGDPNSGWYSGENDTRIYGYLNGEYQILLKIPEWGGAVTPDLVLPSDYRIEVDARQVSSNEGTYGLIFGSRWVGDTYETYQVLVDPTNQEYLLNKRNLDGSWPLLKYWTYSSAIHQGKATNRLRVDRVGTMIYLYINNTLLTTLTESSFITPGRDAGVRAYSYESAPVDMRFDNFSATRP